MEGCQAIHRTIETAQVAIHDRPWRTLGFYRISRAYLEGQPQDGGLYLFCSEDLSICLLNDPNILERAISQHDSCNESQSISPTQ